MGIYRIVMRAGNRLMRRLSMPLKLTLLGSMLLIPLLINVIMGALQDQASIRLTRAERQIDATNAKRAADPVWAQSFNITDTGDSFDWQGFLSGDPALSTEGEERPGGGFSAVA